MNFRIIPPDGFLETRLSLPLSKSMSNRALLINALTPGAPELTDVALCDDTLSMRHGLKPTDANIINIGAAGTTMRFLTAYFATRQGRTVILDGSERMRKRPIKVLVDALRELGAQIDYVMEEGFPPVRITGTNLPGGELTLDASVSSQYISALLMIAPLMEKGLHLTLEGEIVSRPYIKMTLKMMEDAGVTSEFYNNSITVPSGTYTPTLPRLRVIGARLPHGMRLKPFHREWSPSTISAANHVRETANSPTCSPIYVSIPNGKVRTEVLTYAPIRMPMHVSILTSPRIPTSPNI